MKIGLLIAIERELEAFLASGEERTEETVAGKTVYHTRMEGGMTSMPCRAAAVKSTPRREPPC